MSLDAYVFCDCFERGRLKTPPLPEWEVRVADDGGRTPMASNRSLEQDMAFDAWDFDACEHEMGRLSNHYLGNIALISLYRRLLEPNAQSLPVLTQKVIYNGIHAGDRLDLPDVERLAHEVDVLSGIHSADRKEEQFLRHFEAQLRELTQCAREVGKPINF